MRFDRQREIENGRHYEIPECCISYYVDVWLPSLVGKTREEIKAASKARSERRSEWRHIPCDECALMGRTIRIHSCLKEGCQERSNPTSTTSLPLTEG